MDKILIFIFLTFFSSMAAASNFCTRTQNEISALLSKTESRISFDNDGGLFDGGVCWWHGRLQRSSAYLVRFKPQERPPSNPELYKILHSLRVMDRVVTIPGYSNFFDFSEDFHPEIQAMLNEWQIRDGFLNFEWIRGISGKSALSPSEMKARMIDVYNYFKTTPMPVWIMAQIRGITSHAFLIHEMKQTASGYVLDVIDSNHPKETYAVEYKYNDGFLRPFYEKYTFVPYVGFQRDFKLIQASLQKECGNSLRMFGKAPIRDGQIEL